MNQLEQKTISSREVAEMMEVSEHSKMLRKIDSINEILTKAKCGLSEYWYESSYKDSTGRTLREYQVTKKGCELIAHKTEGEKGVLFTIRYMERFEEMESKLEKPRKLSEREIMRLQLDMIDEVSERVDKLENTMVIDYGQQRVLEQLVNRTVLESLGGKEKPAYKEIGKKVFSECNRDIKDRFLVNSRNNIPKLKFDEACKYIKNWQPCTNTKMMIDDCNAQMCMV